MNREIARNGGLCEHVILFASGGFIQGQDVELRSFCAFYGDNRVVRDKCSESFCPVLRFEEGEGR